MLKALIDLFKINRQEKQQPIINEPVVQNIPEPAPIIEPIVIQDEIKIDKETPKRGRPKAGVKPKSNKKK